MPPRKKVSDDRQHNPQSTSFKKFQTLKQFSDEFQFSLSKTKLYVKAGQLDVVHFDRLVRVPPESREAFLARHLAASRVLRQQD